MKYITQRLRLDLEKDMAFPAILNYSYGSFIRPRGEMMISKRVLVDWVDVLDMTDQEFLEKIEGTEEEFLNKKKEFPITNELDIKKRFFSKTFSNAGRTAKY